jgi:hypothetical protein
MVIAIHRYSSPRPGLAGAALARVAPIDGIWIESSISTSTASARSFQVCDEVASGTNAIEYRAIPRC